jgi:electron transport complex protein RnfC
VAIGDTVSLGQKIAEAQAPVSSPVHASISGKVAAIQDWPHPLLGRCRAIVIEGNGTGKSQIPISKSQMEADGLTPEQIRKKVQEAGVVGMGGASFPTHIKLAPPKPVDTLIINGAECEPYLTGDFRLMLEKAFEITQGIEVIVRCLGVKNIIIAIEDNKPEAIKKFQIPNHKLQIKVLKSEYPQGGERQLIRNVLGREVPRGKLPFDIGGVVHNVATVLAVYEAVYLNKPLYERVVTVAGEIVTNPKNLLVRIGTPIKDLISSCGPLKEEAYKIVIGGPMMGLAQYSDEIPVIKSTTGVILLGKAAAKEYEEGYCIRCGACVRACPSGLSPCLINLASVKGLWTEAKAYSALECTECGLCNYVCPARRKLTQSIKRAKLECAK